MPRRARIVTHGLMNAEKFRRHAVAFVASIPQIKAGARRDYWVMASGAIYFRSSECIPPSAVHAGCFTHESELRDILDALEEAWREADVAANARAA